MVSLIRFWPFWLGKRSPAKIEKHDESKANHDASWPCVCGLIVDACLGVFIATVCYCVSYFIILPVLISRKIFGFHGSRYHFHQFPFSRSRYLRFMDTGKQHGHVFRLKIILVVINNHFFKVFKVFYQKRGTSQGFQGCPKHFQGFQSSQGFKVCTLGICKRTCSECYEGSERGES